MPEPTAFSRPLPSLLLIEDNVHIRGQMKNALATEYAVLEAQDRQAASHLLHREKPRLIVLDLGLPSASNFSESLSALHEIAELAPAAKVIVATGDRALALQAVRSGAYDFVEKPVQLDVLRMILQRAAYLSCLEEENRLLQASGEIDALQQVLEMIRRATGGRGALAPAVERMTLKEARAKVEKDLIEQALLERHWNVSRAAESLGISRQSLHELLQKYGLRKSDLKREGAESLS